VDRGSQDNFAYVDIHFGLSVKEVCIFDMVLKYDVGTAFILYEIKKRVG
jgi:hypothetical protein